MSDNHIQSGRLVDILYLLVMLFFAAVAVSPEFTGWLLAAALRPEAR